MISHRLSQRVEAVNESATLAIDGTAKKMLAQGIDVISFAAGEPDFPTPDFIVEAAIAACSDPRNHHYSAAAGLAELRETIATNTKRDSGLEVSPSQVIVTNGGKQAVYEVISALIDPGDEVLIPAPYWVSYPEIVRLAGGVPVAVPTTLETGFKVDVDRLGSYVTDRTKMLIHVSPSNPTGSVYTGEETRALATFLDEAGLFVVTDEIYQHLTYTGSRAPALGEFATETLKERLILVNGCAKTYAMTGWRVGWIVAPLDIAKGVDRLQSQLNSNVSNIMQRAALAALSAPLSATQGMRDQFGKRRELIVSGLAAIPGFEVTWPDGAFYAFPRVDGLIGSSFHGEVLESTFGVAKSLLEHAQVAVVPGEAFDASGYLRFSYALSDENIARGIERVATWAKSCESPS